MTDSTRIPGREHSAAQHAVETVPGPANPAANGIALARLGGFGADRQGVDVGLHHVAQRGIDRAVPRQRRQAGERGTDDAHGEMPVALFAAGMSGVLVTIVGDLQRLRRERDLEQRTHALDPGRVEARDVGGGMPAHGSTRRNGRTSTRAYTPAAT